MDLKQNIENGKYLLRLSITCGLLNSKVNRQMRFSLPSIKCSAAPPSFRLCWLNWAQRCDLITARSTVVGSSEEPPNIWLTVAKTSFVGWPLNLRVRMLYKGAVKRKFVRLHCEVYKRQVILIFSFGKRSICFLWNSKQKIDIGFLLLNWKIARVKRFLIANERPVLLSIVGEVRF